MAPIRNTTIPNKIFIAHKRGVVKISRIKIIQRKHISAVALSLPNVLRVMNAMMTRISHAPTKIAVSNHGFRLELCKTIHRGHNFGRPVIGSIHSNSACQTAVVAYAVKKTLP